MIASDKLARRVLVLLAGSALLLVLGCGDDEKALRKRYPVSGKITLNGTPLETGEISFHPDGAGGRPATGIIKNGSYSLTTLAPGDGAFPGNYKVIVTPRPGGLTKGKAGKASVVIPQKYGLDNSSDLKAEVKTQTNDIPFDLKD